MTRSIGDKAGIDIGLIYTPEILEHRLTHEDKFLIVASDGLWEFLSNKKVVQIVEKYWQEGKAREACEKLVALATACWQREDDVMDDITIIVTFFNCELW
jgi:serine/threonine protein phosphatase PrpC